MTKVDTDSVKRARAVANRVFNVGARYCNEQDLVDLAIGFQVLDGRA